jgi:outer membrane protein OmpA-like peptidoglycan-associated protein
MKRSILAAGLILAVAGCSTPGFRNRSDLVVEPSACTEKRFEVYFTEGEARLTEPARQAIGMTAAQLQGCEIRKVQVLGLASATGDAASNLNLSQRRAVAVAEALTGAGWPAPVFDVEAAGDAGAVANSGVQEPMRRRTEVLIDAVPRR